MLVSEILEGLLRPKEVCQRLGISYPALCRWVREGRIMAIVTAGGKHRICQAGFRRIVKRLKGSALREAFQLERLILKAPLRSVRSADPN
jgi:excisionase family DNA binding protein